VVVPRPAVVATSRDPERIAVALLPVPPAFLRDGQLTEWGSLTAQVDAASTAAPPPSADPHGGEADSLPDEQHDPEPPQGRNPSGAGSVVAIAVGEDGVRIALDVGGAAAGGLWLGIGSPPPAVPPIGEYTRGGGFDLVECTANAQTYVEGTRVITDTPNPPEVIEACKQIVARHAQLRATHAARFARTFHLDAAGVRAVGADGALAPVAGAEIAWRVTGARATAEVTLPLAAMPRLADAPLVTLELFARPSAAARAASPARPGGVLVPPGLARTAWVGARLPEPVSFGRLGELRARVFAPRAEDPEQRHEYWPPRGLSYHPADLDQVESLQWSDTSTVAPRVEVLYTEKAKLGAMTVGEASAAQRHTAIFSGERLVDVVPSAGEARGIVERSGELHVVEYTPEGFAMAQGIFMPPAWSVLAIRADGTHRQALISFGDDEGPWCSHYGDIVPIASPTLDVLGYRSSCPQYQETTKTIEVTWRWDSKSRSYRGSVRDLPGAPRPRSR